MRRRGRRAGKRLAPSSRSISNRWPAGFFLRAKPPTLRSTRRGFFSSRHVCFEPLEQRHLLAASAVISEFLASNAAGIIDQDGNHSDWIEIQNTSASPVESGRLVSHQRRHQSDQMAIPFHHHCRRWISHGVCLGQGSARFGPGAAHELQPRCPRGYLALEMPDQSIASSFAPYPAQITDVSYGITATSTDTEMLVDEQAPMRYNVPTTASRSGQRLAELRLQRFNRRLARGHHRHRLRYRPHRLGRFFDVHQHRTSAA